KNSGGWTHENQRYYDRLLDRHVALRAADGLYGVCPAPPSRGGRGVYASRFPRLLPRRAVVVETGGDPPSAPPCSRSAQGVGVRWLCHHAGLGPHRPLLAGGCCDEVELGRGHRRALGNLVLLFPEPGAFGKPRHVGAAPGARMNPSERI